MSISCRAKLAVLTLVCVLRPLAGPLNGQQSDDTELLVRQISGWNQDLKDLTTGTSISNPARVRAILLERSAALSKLLASNTQRAIELILAQQTIDRLRDLAPPETLESHAEWEGMPEEAVADDFEHHRSRAIWHIRTPEGRRFEVFFGGRTPQPGLAIRVKGIQVGARLAVLDFVPLVGTTVQQCTTVGPQNIAVLMLTMPSFPTLPSGFTQASLSEAFFGSSTDTSNLQSLNGYWKETSYGQTSAVGQVFGPFALSQDYTCDQNTAIATAAINAADGTVDFTKFTRIAMVFPGGCADYGGLSSVGCWTVSSPSKGNLTESESWLPAQGSGPPINIYDHELGHALGLNHASSEDYGSIPLGPLNLPGTTLEYGDPFSAMGGPNCSSGGQYAPQHKAEILHWLAQNSDYQQVTSSGNYTLSPYEASGLRALRILRDQTSNAWLWLEYRQPIGDFDTTLKCLPSNVFNGASIRYEDPTLDPLHTYLLDFNPVSTPNNFNLAAMTAGQSWSDPYSLLTLKVNSASTSGLSVTVNYDTACASLSPNSRNYTSSSAVASDTIALSASGPCTWVGVSNASWITVTGGSSGSGSGTLTYSLTANNTPSPRTGTITVARQTFTITQASSNPQPTPISITPINGSSGSNAPKVFSLVYSDGNGASNLAEISVLFNSSTSKVSACAVSWFKSDNTVRLQDDAADGGYTYWYANQNGAISNSQCHVDFSNAVTTAGNNLTLTLTITFFSSFSGSKNVYMEAQDALGADSGLQLMGSWSVGSTAQKLAFTTPPGNGGVGAALSPVVVQIQDSNGNVVSSSAPVTVTSSPANVNITVAAVNGVATFNNIVFSVPGSYTLTASSTGLTSTVSNSFNIAKLTYTISGQVTSSGIGLSGVTMTLSGGTLASVPTDGSGGYSFSGLTAGGSYTVTPSRSGYTFTPPSMLFTNLSGNQTATFTAMSNVTFTVSGQVTVSAAGLSGVTVSVNGAPTTTTNASGNYSVTLAPGGTYTLSATLAGYSFNAPVTFANLSANQTANFTGIVVAGLRFYPVTPCRVADTRTGSGFTGAFGPPSMTAASTRTFPMPSSACGIPSTAVAYSLNFTVAPPAGLGFLTTWPTGQTMPNASTLNSSTGTVVANAAIVPAGLNGSINVYASNATDVLFDINGYFAPPLASGLQFYPVTPCRVADTRAGSGFSGAFGPPTMAAATQRSFPIPGTCGIPATAAAYSFNFTVVPHGALGYLSAWPAGQSMPNVSTLNSPTGTTVANAAIVPAGVNGAVNVYVSNATDVLFDINGYFAPPTASGLQFYPVTPCRIADTRAGSGFAAVFGPPSMAAASQRSFPVPASTCQIPASAGAYSFNFTVVPQGPLGFLTTWPTGQSMPNVSTLNSSTGTTVANAAIVPAGQNGAVSVYVSNATDVLFDINGYFQ